MKNILQTENPSLIASKSRLSNGDSFVTAYSDQLPLVPGGSQLKWKVIGTNELEPFGNRDPVCFPEQNRIEVLLYHLQRGKNASV